MQKPKKNGKKLFVYTGGLSKEKKDFLENLSVLLSAGLDVLSSLDAVEEEIDSKRMRRFVREIRSKIENGSSLWKAMEESGIFMSSIISLIKVGEMSGKLPENLATVVEQQDKEWMFKTKIRTAMLYPSIVLPLTFFVGIGVAWFALPKLADVFSQLNAELPLLTRIIIATGYFLGRFGAVLIPTVLFAFIIIIYFLFSFPRTKAVGQILISRLPIFKRLIREVELARFGYIMSGLLKSGIPVTDAILSLEDATTFFSYKKFYRSLHKSVEEGNSFKRSFEMCRNSKDLIPRAIQQMIVSGEESGRLSSVLEKIGKSYEVKIETSIKNISTILEPVLLIVIGVAVATIALGVFLPIYSLANIL